MGILRLWSGYRWREIAFGEGEAKFWIQPGVELHALAADEGASTSQESQINAQAVRAFAAEARTGCARRPRRVPTGLTVLRPDHECEMPRSVSIDPKEPLERTTPAQ